MLSTYSLVDGESAAGSRDPGGRVRFSLFFDILYKNETEIQNCFASKTLGRGFNKMPISLDLIITIPSFKSIIKLVLSKSTPN